MEFEKTLSKQQLLDLLDQLRNTIENDKSSAITIDGTTFNWPSHVSCEVEYEDDEEHVEFEIEFKWKKQLPKESTPPIGRFELFQGQDHKWYWHLKAANNQVILTSQGYAAKNSAENGINSVKNNAMSDNFEPRHSKSNQAYFVLKAKNGEIIGTSQMYKRNAGCQKGIRSVIQNLEAAIVQL